MTQGLCRIALALRPVCWVGLAASIASGAPITVFLKNGDRITAEMVSENAERLVLKSSLFGELKVPKDQISRREPLPPVSATGEKNPGATAAGGYKGAVTNAPGVRAYAVVDPRRYFPGWTRPLATNWHGTIQLGVDLGFGTTDRKTFNANAAVNHAYDRFRNNLTYRAAYGTAETPATATTPRSSLLTADSMEGLWKTDFDLGAKRKIYLYHQTGAGYDEIRRYQLRFEEGMGVGYKLINQPSKVINQPKLNVNLETGFQYQHLAYKNGPVLLPALPDTDILSVRFGENLIWRVSDKLKITQRVQITPNVEDASEFRARFEFGLSYPLFKRVTLNLNAFDEYDSKPAAFVANNQLQVQSTVGITF